jgi:hypothetical protein
MRSDPNRRPDWEGTHNERMARMRAEHNKMDRQMKGCMGLGMFGFVIVGVINLAIVVLAGWGIYALIQYLNRH